MRTSAVLASTLALAAPALADWYMYAANIQPNFGEIIVPIEGFGFYAGPPSCDDVLKTIQQTSSEDVSSRNGVRCKGCGLSLEGSGGAKATEVEINDDVVGHYTWYADREGAPIVDLNGNNRGSCKVDGVDTYTCSDVGSTFRGTSQLFCTTDIPIPGKD